MSSIFSKILRGDIPCVKVAETGSCFAIMDINPLQIGHLLVIPKVEVDEIYELEDEDLTELHLLAKKLSQAMKLTFQKRIAQVVLGLEVPHAHIHLIPINSESDISFSNPKLKLSTEELTEIANSIIKNIHSQD